MWIYYSNFRWHTNIWYWMTMLILDQFICNNIVVMKHHSKELLFKVTLKLFVQTLDHTDSSLNKLFSFLLKSGGPKTTFSVFSNLFPFPLQNGLFFWKRSWKLPAILKVIRSLLSRSFEYQIFSKNLKYKKG